MKAMRKFVSTVLVLCFIGTQPLIASATEISAIPQNVQSAIRIIQENNSEATIRYENGTIHVYTPNTHQEEVSERGMFSASIYAPNGGSWREFTLPSYVSPVNGDTIPYLVTYLPGDRAEALYTSMTVPGFWDTVTVANLTALGVEGVKKLVAETLGIGLTNTQILFLYSEACSQLYNNVNIYSLANAKDATDDGKVRIDFTTINDAPVNYYYSWTGNTVTDSPWQDFNPTFYAGEYWV